MSEVEFLRKLVGDLCLYSYGWYERHYVQGYLNKLKERKMDVSDVICDNCKQKYKHTWTCPNRITHKDGCEKCGFLGGHYIECPMTDSPKRVKEQVEHTYIGGTVHGFTNHPDMKKRGKAGNKYIRTIYPKWPDSGQQPIQIDIYRILQAYQVTNSAIAHAVKKLLCAGLRDKADALTDLKEALECCEEAVL